MPGTNVILPGASPGIDSRSRITPKYDTRGRFIVEDFEGPNRTLAQMFPLQVGTTASIDTQQAKFGGQSIRITQTGTASSSKVQASKQVKSAMAIVGRFWFRLDNLPGVLIQILNIGSGINGLIQITSGSLFSSGFTGSVQSGAQPTTKVWHAVDYRIDYRDHTMLFDAMIDGVANTQATIANNATSMGVDDFNFANSGATTVTYWIDGWQQSDSIRDYPLSDDPSWVPFVDPTKWQKPHFMFKQIMFDVPLVFPEFAPAPTVGPTDYIDSDTVILLLVPSAVETADLVDLDTVLMSLTPSATEIYGRTDADTVTMSLVPSATEVEAAVDSATVNLALTPSQSETEQAVDSATIGLSLVPSAAEIMQSVDSATIPITLTPSATEVYGRTDAATIPLTLTPSATETAGAVDSATVTMTLTPSATETIQDVDSATVPLTLTPGGTEQKVALDSATVTMSLTPSGTDTSQYVDSATVTMALTPSDSQAFAGVDSNTVPLTLAPSALEGRVLTDASTVTLALTPSATEFAARVDSATVPVTLVPSTFAGLTDAATVNMTLTAATVFERRIVIDTYIVNIGLNFRWAAAGTFKWSGTTVGDRWNVGLFNDRWNTENVGTLPGS